MHDKISWQTEATTALEKGIYPYFKPILSVVRTSGKEILMIGANSHLGPANYHVIKTASQHTGATEIPGNGIEHLRLFDVNYVDPETGELYRNGANWRRAPSPTGNQLRGMNILHRPHSRI
jgi:hypothetical protein